MSYCHWPLLNASKFWIGKYILFASLLMYICRLWGCGNQIHCIFYLLLNSTRNLHKLLKRKFMSYFLDFCLLLSGNKVGLSLVLNENKRKRHTVLTVSMRLYGQHALARTVNTRTLKIHILWEKTTYGLHETNLELKSP